MEITTKYNMNEIIYVFADNVWQKAEIKTIYVVHDDKKTVVMYKVYCLEDKTFIDPIHEEDISPRQEI